MESRNKRPKSALEVLHKRTHSINEVLVKSFVVHRKPRDGADSPFSVMKKRERPNESIAETAASRRDSELLQVLEKKKAGSSSSGSCLSSRKREEGSASLSSTPTSCKEMTPQSKKAAPIHSRGSAPLKKRQGESSISIAKNNKSSTVGHSTHRAVYKTCLEEKKSSKVERREINLSMTTPKIAPTLSGGILDEFFTKNGFYKGSIYSNKEINVKKESAKKDDVYCQKLDDHLEQLRVNLTTKISEKREKESQSANVQVKLDEIKKEIIKAHGYCEKINNQIAKQHEKNKELERVNQDVMTRIMNIKGKREEKEKEFNNEMSKITTFRAQMGQILSKRKDEHRFLIDYISITKRTATEEVKNLEKKYFELDHAYNLHKKKAEYSKNMERTRLKLLKEKGKLLDSLIKNEIAVASSQQTTPSSKTAVKFQGSNNFARNK